MQSLGADFPNCDLLLVIGTSLEVQPFASLIGLAPFDCNRVLINRRKVGEDVHTLGDCGPFDFDRNPEDVFMPGDCDDVIYRIADAAGWRKKLDALVDSFRVEKSSAVFQAGDRVMTTQELMSDSEEPVKLPKSTQGVVKRIDSDGDASIDFEGTELVEWVFKERFALLQSVS